MQESREFSSLLHKSLNIKVGLKMEKKVILADYGLEPFLL
jgi:hypothetical protein